MNPKVLKQYPELTTRPNLVTLLSGNRGLQRFILKQCEYLRQSAKDLQDAVYAQRLFTALYRDIVAELRILEERYNPARPGPDAHAWNELYGFIRNVYLNLMRDRLGCKFMRLRSKYDVKKELK